jgi:hypothetical protein
MTAACLRALLQWVVVCGVPGRCLDITCDAAGKVVVTKGNQYVFHDVSASGETVVRDLGDPVEVAERYYHQVKRR